MTASATRLTRARKAVAIAAGVLVCGIAIALGNWQTRRAEEKLAVERERQALERSAPLPLDTAASVAKVERVLPARVRLRGRPDHERSIWLDNRMLEGHPGFYVLTPVVLADAAGVVLVNRGWVARDLRAPTRLPKVGGPEVVHIEGLAFSGVPRLLELGKPRHTGPLPAIWQNLDLDAARSATQLPLAGFVVQQTSPADDGLVRNWPRSGSGAQKHRGYAFQWYALAALIGILTVFFSLRGLLRRASPTFERPEPPQKSA